jgi:hypothetical protein
VTHPPYRPPADVRALLSERASTFRDGTLVVLPVRIPEDGTGWYRDELLTAPKDLRSLGVPADFLHTRNQRTGLSEHSEEIVVAFALGVAQNMTWDAAKTAVEYLFARARQITTQDHPSVTVSVDRVHRVDGTSLEGVNITGLADDGCAARVIRALTGIEEAP